MYWESSEQRPAIYMYTYRLGMTILQTELFYKYYSKESFEVTMEKRCVFFSTYTSNSNDDVMIGK